MGVWYVPIIPDGAKLNDEELANLMSFNLLLGINYTSRGLTESIRADVGLIFFKIIVRKTIFGATVKKLMDERGWLHAPPIYKSKLTSYHIPSVFSKNYPHTLFSYPIGFPLFIVFLSLMPKIKELFQYKTLKVLV